LLERAVSLAAADGRVVYSTCSLEPEENERLVQRFCERHANWRVADSLLTLPAPDAPARQWRDGGYFALLIPAR
jgi:16S rRNA (cytosine967-C5)-methyltransferase